jgi:AraC family transcriptional regulator
MLMERSTGFERSGYTERVFTQASTRGATISIVDNVLDGSEIHGCESSHLLRWRLAPSHIGAPGCLGDQSEYVPFGKLMFFPAQIPYRTRRFNQAEKNRNVVCRFQDDLNDIISELDNTWNRAQLERCLDINCGRIDLAMQRLSHELTHPGFASEMLLDSLLTSLAIDITRYFKTGAAEPEDTSHGRELTAVHLERITEYIVNAREGCPTAADIAEICGMPASSFRQRFKNTTGQSLHAYVEQVRLGRAKSFLANTEMAMKEIAYDLGFTHQATFTSSFRRATGMSPTEYRLTRRH